MIIPLTPSGHPPLFGFSMFAILITSKKIKLKLAFTWSDSYKKL